MFRKQVITVPVFAFTLLLSCSLSGMNQGKALLNLGNLGNVLHTQESSFQNIIETTNSLKEAYKKMETILGMHEVDELARLRALAYNSVSGKDILELEIALWNCEKAVAEFRATSNHPQVGASLQHTYTKGNGLAGFQSFMVHGRRLRAKALERFKNQSPCRYILFYVNRYMSINPKTMPAEEYAHALDRLSDLNQVYKDKILNFGPEGTNYELKQHFAILLTQLHTHLTRK